MYLSHNSLVSVILTELVSGNQKSPKNTADGDGNVTLKKAYGLDPIQRH